MMFPTVLLFTDGDDDDVFSSRLGATSFSRQSRDDKIMRRTFALKLLAYITDRKGHDRKSVVNGFVTKTLGAIPNDYHSDKLPTIPAGTVIECDFGGDFGLYATADIQGVLHRIKINLGDLHLIDWSERRDAINAY